MNRQAWVLTRSVVGAVLLAAALLKGSQYLSRGTVAGWIDSPSLAMLVAEAEFVLGALLLLGLWPELTRRAAILCFAVFAAAALFMAIGGERSCGCFGAVDVHPWFVFAFDLCAVLSLLASKPTQTRSDGAWRFWRYARPALLLALLGCAAGMTASALSKPPPPELVAVPPIFGAGDLVVRCDVPIVNRLDKRCVFSHVDASCGCSNAKLLKADLEAGEATTLHVDVSMGSQGGRRRVLCSLESDTGERQAHLVEVAAYPFLQFPERGPEVAFGHLEPNQTAERSMVLSLHSAGMGSEPPRVVSVEPDSSYVTAEFENGDQVVPLSDGSGMRRTCVLRLSLDGRSPAGSHLSTIQVKYQGPHASGSAQAVAIWATRTVFLIDPERVYLDGFNDEPIRRFVEIQRRDGAPLRVLSAVCDSPSVAVEDIQTVDAACARIALKITPNPADDTLFAVVRVRTDQLEQAEALITVSGLRSAR